MEDINTYILSKLDSEEKKALWIYSKHYGSDSFGEFTSKNFDEEDVNENFKFNQEKIKNFLQKLYENHSILYKSPEIPIRDVFIKILRIIVNYGYNYGGYKTTKDLIQNITTDVSEVSFIEGFPIDRMVEDIETMFEQLEKLDKTKKLYDWPHGYNSFERLTDFLYNCGYISSKSDIRVSFMIENPKTKDKVIWNKDLADLVYLSYRAWFKSNPNEYKIIAKRRFKDNYGNEFNTESLRTTFYNIYDECKNNNVIKKRIPLRKIFDDLDL